MPYCNNLRTNDPVLDVARSRKGKVYSQPRESSVNVQVLLDGNNSPTYIHISQLRLIVDGKPEEVAPHDGELAIRYPCTGEGREHKPKAAPAGDEVTKPLRERRAFLKSKMDEMTKEFVAMRAECDTLDKALELLGGAKA